MFDKPIQVNTFFTGSHVWSSYTGKLYLY